MTAIKYKIGQKIFAVITVNVRTPDCRVETITKVGRKWITYGEGWRSRRFNAKTGWIDGGNYGSPGRVYDSEDSYRAEHEANFYMHDLYVKMWHKAKPGVQTCDIKEVAKLLHIELGVF